MRSSDRTFVQGQAPGRTWRFQRVDNTHSGAFFLNARQMPRWATLPTFLDRDPGQPAPRNAFLVD